MRTLVFDTETTGVWNFKDSPFGAGQPGLCQLGAILYNDQKVAAELNVVVRPLGLRDGAVVDIKIPAETTAIHGISDALVDQVGVPYKVALAMFNNLLKISDRVVAFNAAFDRDVMKCAFNRIAADQELLVTTPLRCAMLSAAPAVKIPGKYGDKWGWPKLQDAYKKLVDPAGFEGAHDAMADVRAAAAVLFKLEETGYEIVSPSR